MDKKNEKVIAKYLSGKDAPDFVNVSPKNHQ